MNKQPIRGTEPGSLAEEQIARVPGGAPGILRASPRACSRDCGCHTSAAARRCRSSSARCWCCARSTQTLEQKLHELIENGRANDAITDRMHRLTRRLLRARDLKSAVAALETSLREDFGASRWLVLLTDPSMPGLAGLPEPSRARRGEGQRRTEAVRDFLRVRAAAQRPDPRHAARLPVRHRGECRSARPC